MAQARVSGNSRRGGVIAIMFVCAVLCGWVAIPDTAAAQIPDPDDIELPDPPDVDLPDVDLPDVDLPDVDVPDPPDVDVPDPDDDPDDDPDVDDDPGDDPGTDDNPSEPEERRDHAPVPGRGDRSGGGGPSATEDSEVPFSHLAAARGEGGLVILPQESVAVPSSGSEDDGQGLAELLAPLVFPMLLMVAVGAFLTLQDHLQRRDPRRLLALPVSKDRPHTS